MVIETKTWQKFALPSPAQTRVDRFQVQCYRLLLQNMKRGQFGIAELLQLYGLTSNECPRKQFLISLEIGPLHTVFQEVSLGKFCRRSFTVLRRLLPLSKHLCFRYIHAADGQLIGEDWFEFDEVLLLANLRIAAAYWFGEREPRPTLEAWKCTYCTYRDR